MKLRTYRLWLAAAVWPFCYLLVMIPLAYSLQGKLGPAGPPDTWPWWIKGLIAVHAGTIVIGGSALVLCLVYLFKHSRLFGRKRMMWAILLVLGGGVAAPFFIAWHVEADSGAV